MGWDESPEPTVASYRNPYTVLNVAEDQDGLDAVRVTTSPEALKETPVRACRE